MSLLKEFKEFAARGSVVDLAVGLIMGGAFGKIVSSLVDDILMPPIGLLIGGVDFSRLAVTLKAGIVQENIAPVMLRYGLFLQRVLDFLIVAFAIFLLIKGINTLRRKQEQAAETAPSKQEVLLGEIRDLLKEGKR